MASLFLFVESLVPLIKVGSAMFKHACDASICILFRQCLEVLFNTFQQRLFNDGLTSVHKV